MTSDEAQSHYLDRVCESLRATGHQINRALYAYSLLSIVALASLLELDPHASRLHPIRRQPHVLPALPATSVSVAIACGLMYHTGLILHEEHLCDTAVALYRASGFDHPTLKGICCPPTRSRNSTHGRTARDNHTGQLPADLPACALAHNPSFLWGYPSPRRSQSRPGWQPCTSRRGR